jgi:hypothetical protein
MITLKLNQIPLFLQNSQLYKNLVSEDDQETIDIPEKYNLKLNKSYQFVELLDILRYWMVDAIPVQIYDYVYKRNLNIHLFHDRFKDFTPFIDEFKILNEKKHCYVSDPLGSRIKEAITSNYLNLLKYLYPKAGISFRRSTDLCKIAVANDNLEILIYLRKNKCSWNSDTYQCALNNKSEKCLKYLEKHNCPKPEPSMYIPLNFWYSNNPSMSIPYTSLPSNNVSFNLTFNHQVTGMNWVTQEMTRPIRMIRKTYPKWLLLTNE